jgi:hypothetical protein
MVGIKKTLEKQDVPIKNLATDTIHYKHKPEHERPLMFTKIKEKSKNDDDEAFR